MRQILISKATLILVVCLILVPYFPRAAARAGPKTPDPLQRANELLELSQNQNLTNHPLAIQTAQEAVVLFQSANDQVGLATSYALLGQYHLAHNSTTESAQYFTSALQIWRQQHNVLQEANALIMLGYVEGRNGEWLNGVSYLTQALNLIDEQNDLAYMGRIASGMAYVFNESGLPEYGLTQFQRAREYFGQAKSYRYYTRAIMLTGYTYFLLKNYPAALTNLQEALDGFINLGAQASKLDIAECHENMGRVYIAMGQYEVALQHLQRVLPVYESAGNPGDAAQVRALIGQIYEQQGKVVAARANYLAASQTFRQVGNRLNEAAVRFALGRLEMRQGNYDAAEKYLKASIDNTEEIRRDLTSRVFAAAFSASVQDRYEAYVECLLRKQKPSQGLEVLAFQASEQAKARSLAELLRDTQTKLSAGADPQLAEQERTLKQSIRAKVDQTITLLANDYRKEDLDQLETSLTSLREQHQRVAERMRASMPNSDHLEEPVTYSVQQVQDLILEDDQTMLLEYFLGQNASHVWAITHNGIKVFELPKAAVITEAVRKVYDILSTEPASDTDNRLNKATDELGQMVLGPLAGQLNASRVIVVADGALNYIPFQLLPAPSRNHEPLVANFEVINAPSASILGQLRLEKQNRPARTRVLAAFGDPVFASNYAQFKNSNSSELLALKVEKAEPWRRAWRDIEVNADSLDPSVIQPLIYSKFELKNLRDIAGPESLVARGFDASRQVLENTDLSKYAILHFATHGVLNPRNPELSGFFLSMIDAAGQPQDGFITMQDVYSLHAPVDLVVLSACRTGLGKDVRGEGLIGLTRGFMHAGASSVVASLWKVDDEATAELMKHFYVNMLQKGMRPAAALRAAQNTLRQNPQWQSPHFWASFTLQGEFKQPIRLPATTATSPKFQSAVGAGLLMTLLAVICVICGWFIRR